MSQQAHAKAVDDVAVLSQQADGSFMLSCKGVRFELRIHGDGLSVRCLDGALVVYPNTTQDVVLHRREP